MRTLEIYRRERLANGDLAGFYFITSFQVPNDKNLTEQAIIWHANSATDLSRYAPRTVFEIHERLATWERGV